MNATAISHKSADAAPVVTAPVVAALYVMPGGPYCGLKGVEAWDESRDARTYAGPWPVVAHPPCDRWGRYWSGGPSARVRRKLGEDGGCFDRALWAVRTFGGVLEHPADSAAWAWYGLREPPRAGGWVAADYLDGWTCCVEQGHYGHRARKATWLYAVRTELPALRWGSSGQRLPAHLNDYKRARRTGIGQCLSKRERAETPPPFRDLLLAMARSAWRSERP